MWCYKAELIAMSRNFQKLISAVLQKDALEAKEELRWNELFKVSSFQGPEFSD